jgi:predicted Zn-dependent protease
MPPFAEARFEALKQFVAHDPADSFSRYALALELWKRDDRAQALEQLLELQRRDAAYVALYYQLGQLYRELGSTGEARKTFEDGIKAATLAGDSHAASELTDALDEL